ncbi:MAG: hypothetical protein ERJ68_09330 [Aphanocapsa feldmannii 277cI]|uniref:Uncharacterized protein n=1 Tax=Aphanocapsa feldmannii 277cI TaxID=2507554 RepID=A0A524RRH8_9CHRO|nr:MAG: hypothetical protein ERJ68_09330 [Aphanocapsa feldmannii 277cI]
MSGGRFDNLFAWMDEPEAIRCLRTPADQLDIPAAQYVAATRLGAASSEASLLALLDAARFRGDDINNRLTRRKALEALGRRRDPRSLALVRPPTILRPWSMPPTVSPPWHHWTTPRLPLP